jgi:malate dehydrogenase
MQRVAILGAGELGGAIAHVLARRDTAAAVQIIDETGNVAAGKALDIMQSAAIDGFAAQVTGETSLRSTEAVSALILADCAARGEWRGDDALLLLQRLGPGPRTTIVCAGAGQRDVVERGARELRFPRARLFGTAPEALAAGIRGSVARETNGSARDVMVTVLGIPPGQVVVPWEDAAVGGIAATRVLDDVARRRVAARLPSLWPPGPYALAAAASQAVDAILGRSRRMVSCFVAPAEEAGARMRAAAMPVVLGPAGIVSVEMPTLAGHDRVVFDNAVLL